MTKCKLTSDSGAIAVTTPYDSDFVYELKRQIPASDRRYQKDKRIWLVSPRWGTTLQNICLSVFNEMPMLPPIGSATPTVTQKIIDCRYIGQTKSRGGDERSAYGWVNGGWNVIFPEAVLRSWFDAPQYPDEQPTLYSVLCVGRGATPEEIKQGYRRMVMQWHPDHSREPNAHEQFLVIQHAYEVLTKNKERYDAGLAFEDSLRKTPRDSGYSSLPWADGYRSPLRCGLIMVEGTETMGLFQVSKIYAWQDVINSKGQVLVSSWPKGADTFEERWI